ncbi:hypothetical protein HC124_02965 [Winkia neuii]|uniref:hypothetical protein n=1 Tax=Winkia TaxID=2692118 RepID=UPI00143208C2|nr:MULTISPECIES: hypothetical protein [Winkia]MDK7186030.1 hypothetical protein [Winkia sp. UMB1295B]NJJ15187.1 hypothetical protein [Winkia neuii]
MISCPPVETKVKTAIVALVLGLLAVLLPGQAVAEPSPLLRQHGHLVVLGTSGLRWQDVDFSDPASRPFAKFAEEGVVANLVTRSTAAVSCPADGWLSLGAGQRATISRRSGKCAFPQVRDQQVQGWKQLTADVIPAGQVGLGYLQAALAQDRKSAVAVGPGAALALADKDGKLARPVLRNTGNLADTVSTAARENHVTVVDTGAVDPANPPQVTGQLNPTPQGGYPQLDQKASDRVQVRAKVRQLSQIVKALPEGTQVIIASLAEGNQVPHLQLLAMQADAFAPGLAKSGSLRRDGLVQTADLTQTILQSIGATPAENSPGATVWTAGRSGKIDFPDRIASLLDRSVKTDTARVTQPAFFILWFTLAGVTILIGLARYFRRSKGRAIEKVPTVLAQLTAAIPVASLLANLLPTWRFDTNSTASAVVISLTCLVVVAAVLVALAHGVARWLRPHIPQSVARPLNAPVVLAAITLVVFAWVIASRAPLQLDSATGTTTIAGNRFYGSGNTEFTLMAVCFVILAAWSGSALFAAVLGLALAVIDGFPTMGADFGGPPAILFVTVLLSTWLRGKKVRLRHLLLAVVAAFAGTALFAVIDYLQAPQARTHLGRFVATVIEGGAWPIVQRKAHAAWLTVAGSAGTLVAACLFVIAIGCIAVVLYSPRFSTRVSAYHRNVLLSATILLVIASLSNDSGMLILTIGLLLVGVLICGGLFRMALTLPARKTSFIRLPATRRWPRRLGLALVCTALLGATLAAITASPSDANTHQIPKAGRAPVVAVFTEGIRWEKVTARTAPSLYERAASGSSANLVPLALSGPSCPIDSWLTLNAGQRAWRNSLGGYEICSSLQQLPEADAASSRPALRRWGYYSKAMAQMTNKPTLGALGEAVTAHNLRARAIGNGAGVALANAKGIPQGTLVKAPANSQELAATVAKDLGTYDLTVVDANAISTVQNPDRAAAATRRAIRNAKEETGEEPTEVQVRPELRSLDNPEVSVGSKPDVEDAAEVPETAFSIKTDQEASTDAQRAKLVEKQGERQLARLEAVVKAIPKDARLIVVSSADFGVRSYMQTAVLAGPGVSPAKQGGLARSSSVRQRGIVQLPDVTATVGDWLGFDMPGAGSAITNQIALGDESMNVRHAFLTDQADRAFAMRDARANFYGMLVTCTVTIILVLAVLALGVGAGFHIARFWRALLRFSCLTVASIPLATLALSAFCWWHFQDTHAALNGGSLALAALLAAATLAGPWRQAGAPALVIAGATAFAIALDVITGTRALIDSPFGFNSLAAARYYGVGNETFSLLSVGTILLAGWVGSQFCKQWVKTVAVLGVCALFLYVDAAPSVGADFGGILAFIPGIAVLVILIGGYRLRWRWVVPIALAMVGGAGLVALLDWMRPASSRTHLGRFVQSTLDGDMLPIIVGKLQTNLRLLSVSTLRWVVVAALVAVAVWLCYTYPRLRGRKAHLPQQITWMVDKAAVKIAKLAGCAIPNTGTRMRLRALPKWVHPCAWALLTTQAMAFALNDSGIVLPGVAAIMAIPAAADTILDALVRNDYLERT